MLSILLIGILELVALIIWFCIYIIAVGPVIVGGYYYAKFLRAPSWETRKQLPRAHLYNMISIALQFGLFTIFGLAANNGRPLPIGGVIANASGATIWIYNVIAFAINILLNYYWMGVTARYSNM